MPPFILAIGPAIKTLLAAVSIGRSFATGENTEMAKAFADLTYLLTKTALIRPLIHAV